MRLEDDFRDLAPLDPSQDGARWERMVAGITLASAPELQRRTRLPDMGLLQLLAGYVRPAVSAAALMAAAAGAVFVAAGEQSTTVADGDAVSQAQVASGMGYPSSVAGWVASDNTPSASEMVAAMQGD